MDVRPLLGSVWAALWTFAFAVVLTAVGRFVWSGLLIANLKTTPALPWSVVAMASVLVGVFNFLNGNWGWARTRKARQSLLRARSVPPTVLGWALLAGGLAVVALAGFWIVLSQLVKMPGNTSRFSSLPLATLISALVMASLSGAVTEEAGFRGYFQGTLERYVSAPFAILIAALAMIPEHAATQGFVWPTILFYLVFDAMMGAMAYLTRSILPGIATHFVGLMTFFGLIWPNDRVRVRVLEAGADTWFLIHLCQALVFAVLSLWAFRQLAKASARWFPQKLETVP